METNNPLFDFYRKEVYRIGWRVQYQLKKTVRREVPLVTDFDATEDFTHESISSLFTAQIINSLPRGIQRKIIYEIYINEKTESSVARELNLSQQAVSRWKRKSLDFLRQNMNS